MILVRYFDYFNFKLTPQGEKFSFLDLFSSGDFSEIAEGKRDSDQWRESSPLWSLEKEPDINAIPAVGNFDWLSENGGFLSGNDVVLWGSGCSWIRLMSYLKSCYGLGMKCSPKDSCLEVLVSIAAMFRSGAFEKWLNHEVSHLLVD